MSRGSSPFFAAPEAQVSCQDCRLTNGAAVDRPTTTLLGTLRMRSLESLPMNQFVKITILASVLACSACSINGPDKIAKSAENVTQCKDPRPQICTREYLPVAPQNTLVSIVSPRHALLQKS
jgi:hypothetical protein